MSYCPCVKGIILEHTPFGLQQIERHCVEMERLLGSRRSAT